MQMTSRIAGTSHRTAAIVSGVSILVMTVAAVIATDLVLGRLVVTEDAEATADNIMASQMLFRTGVFSLLVVLLCDVLAAWGLYIFLEPVNRSISLLTAWLRIVYAAMLGAAIFNLIDVMLLVRGEYPAAFGAEQLPDRVMLSLDAFNDTWSIGLVIFGIHILLLGYLAFKSGYIPKVFGILMIIASFGYVITYAAELFITGQETVRNIIEWIFIAPQVVGEVGLALWLVVKVVRSQPFRVVQ